jgi:hypothetical protein
MPLWGRTDGGRGFPESFDKLRTGLWFDELTMIGGRGNPFVLSLSKDELTTNEL